MRYRVPIKFSTSQRRRTYAGRKALLTLASALLAAGLMLADRWGAFGQRNVPDFQKYDGQTFVVAKAVDGDTLDLDVPDGKWHHTRVRLWGVDTPETKDPRKPKGYHAFFGPEASDFTARAALGQRVKVQLEAGGKSRDKYGRLLAWIMLPDGRCLNCVLVQDGYAYADPRFENSRQRELARLQSAAMKAHKGLWVHGVPDDIPDYYASGRHKLPQP